jgi:acyl carrier protein
MARTESKGEHEVNTNRLIRSAIRTHGLEAPAGAIAEAILREHKTVVTEQDINAVRHWVRREASGEGNAVEERVLDIVCENLGVNRDQVTRQTSFQDDIGADSLDIVELVMELEEEFEITIPDDQAEKIKTVGEAIEYIEREQAKK